MKTTAMFVEQVLIGGLLLIVIALLFPEWVKCWQPTGTLKSVLFGTTALGASYLIGIIYDRFADTLLADQEKCSRLRYGLDRKEKKGRRATKHDLFPVDKFQIMALSAGEGITDHVNYLRTRIRLARALASLLPALMISLSVYRIVTKQFVYVCGTPFLPEPYANHRSVGLWALVISYVGVFLWKQHLRPKKLLEPPKTYSDKSINDHVECIEKYLDKWWVKLDSVFYALGGLTGVAVYLEYSGTDRCFLILPAVGLGLTLLSGWSWLRVHETHMQLLDDYHQYRPRKEAT
jgi:hypothetical protein